MADADRREGRTVFAATGREEDLYEERVTVWRASDADEAIALAEADAAAYVDGLGVVYLGLAQAYAMADELRNGVEVYSLMRTSTLAPAQYLDAFFDTGDELQRRPG